MRTTMKKLILASLLVPTVLLATGSVNAALLYFPHVDTNLPWQTEIAIINTGDQTITGTLRGYNDEGLLKDTRPLTTLSARGRRQITVANEFTNHTDISYITFDTNSTAVQGYTKFYQAGKYRAAVPAVKEVNTSVIYVPHIAANAPQWWTGVGLVNTTSETRNLTITFNTGLSVPYTLTPYGHGAFDIAAEFFNNQPPPDLQSAVITNASGIIGLELFGGNRGGSNYLDGILLTDKTASTLYYPHVENKGWWTGIVAYNTSESVSTITITPYSAQGTSFTPVTRSIPGKGKYIGLVSDLALPAQTAWFKIDSTAPLSGFELFGTSDDNQLAAYAGGGGTSAKAGVFPKIEKSGGWTGIAFVNTEALAASVTLTAYRDNGTTAATRVLSVDGHAKVLDYAWKIFSPQDISTATYIGYSSDKNVVGFQLNGTSDGKMLDGLSGLAEGGVVDTKPPTVPTGLTATAVSESRIDLSWTASIDNVGVAGYGIYHGNFIGLPAIKNVTGTSTSMTGLNPSTQYCYEVRAYDAANNLSFNTAPKCAITKPPVPAARYLRVVNDLYDQTIGENLWGKWNPIIRVRIAATENAVINDSTNTYEKLAPYESTCSVDFTNQISPKYQKTTSYQDFDVSSLPSNYYVYIQTGWWEVDAMTSCWVKHMTTVICCDCQGMCYKNMTIFVSGHTSGAEIINASQFLTQGNWCLSTFCP